MPETHQTIMTRVYDLRRCPDAERVLQIWDELNAALATFSIERWSAGWDDAERLYTTSRVIRESETKGAI